LPRRAEARPTSGRGLILAGALSPGRRGSGSGGFAHGVGSYGVCEGVRDRYASPTEWAPTGVCGSAFRPTAERWVGTGVGLKPDPPRGVRVFVGALSPGRRGSRSECFAHGVGSYGGLWVGLQADGGTLGRHRRRAEARSTQGARVDFRRSPVPRAKGFGVRMLRPRSGLLRGSAKGFGIAMLRPRSGLLRGSVGRPSGRRRNVGSAPASG
jgi:hypothetical protein